MVESESRDRIWEKRDEYSSSVFGAAAKVRIESGSHVRRVRGTRCSFVVLRKALAGREREKAVERKFTFASQFFRGWSREIELNLLDF